MFHIKKINPKLKLKKFEIKKKKKQNPNNNLVQHETT
jgi:hypothetical protein